MTNPEKAQKVDGPKADILAEAAKAAGGKGLPPVHLWNPPFQGDIDMRIARDGTWYHEGGAISRKPLVKLFSSILRKDGDAYFLVTPAERVGITVEDAPFVAVDIDAAGGGENQMLTFTTQVDDVAVAGADHPIRVERDAETGEPAPYVLIRANLEALIDRKSFYRMIELGCERLIDDVNWFGVWSSGQFFPIIPASDLE